MIDNFLTIGKGHEICEDYTIMGDSPTPYLIISDGCSSSKNTDLGARILAHSFKKQFLAVDSLEHLNLPFLGLTSLPEAKVLISLLNLNDSALDATLLFGYEIPKHNIFAIICFGDGYIFTKNTEGIITIHEISYKQEAPYYLNIHGYSGYNNRKKQWEKDFPDNVRVDKVLKFNEQGECIENKEVKFKEKVHSLDTYPIMHLNLGKFESIGIASDGIGSFLDYNGNKIPIYDCVKEILAFKIKKGQFLRRRMKKMLKDYAKKDIYAYDDISVAVLLPEKE